MNKKISIKVLTTFICICLAITLLAVVCTEYLNRSNVAYAITETSETNINEAYSATPDTSKTVCADASATNDSDTPIEVVKTPILTSGSTYSVIGDSYSAASWNHDSSVADDENPWYIPNKWWYKVGEHFGLVLNDDVAYGGSGLLESEHNIFDYQLSKLQTSDYYFVLVGCNDLANGYTEDEVYDKYCELIHYLRNEKGGEVIMFMYGIPKAALDTSMENSYLYKANNLARRVASDTNTIIVDTHIYFDSEDELNSIVEKYTVDGLHPSVTGHQLMADAIISKLTTMAL